MYNKYFTMKRSELKEAIKTEIKSVLSEEIQVGDIVTLTTGGDKLEVIDSRRMFGSDMMAYRVKKVDGTKFNANVDFPEIGDETVEYSGDQLRLAEGDLKEESRFPTQADIDDIENSGNIDIAYNKAMKLLKSLMNKSVSFSDVREEDEPTDAEIKKADSVASAANKLQKLVKKMKDKAKDFKAAEGEAKEKIKDELKAMTAEKKKLEKAL